MSAILALAIGGVLIFAVVRESRHSGRLLGVPRVDDVLYLGRGAELLDAWRNAGVAGVVRDWLAHPPHSPYASGISFLAFALFGVREWGPYVLTGIPVAWFLWLAARLSARRSLTVGVLIMLSAACVPMFAASIHNLKPDYVAGMLGAAGVGIAAIGARWRLRSALWAGACFGLAVWAKPTMAPLPGVVAAACAAVLVALPIRSTRARRMRAVWNACAMLGVAALLVGALALIDGARVFGYVQETLAGESSERWRTSDTVWIRAAYHLTGPGGRLMLGAQVWTLLGVSFAACSAAWWRGRRSERLVLLSVGAPMLVALAVVAAVPMRIAQFGACFQACLVLIAALGIGVLVRRARAVTRRAWPGVALAACIAAAMLISARWTFPRATTPGQRARAIERREIAERVYRAAHRALAGRPGAIVIAGDPGDICPELFRFWGVRDLWVVNATRVWDVDGRGQIAAAGIGDVAVVASGETGMTALKRSRPGANDRLAAAVMSAEWEVIERVPGMGGRGEFIIARRARIGVVFPRPGAWFAGR